MFVIARVNGSRVRIWRRVFTRAMLCVGGGETHIHGLILAAFNKSNSKQQRWFPADSAGSQLNVERQSVALTMTRVRRAGPYLANETTSRPTAHTGEDSNGHSLPTSEFLARSSAIPPAGRHKVTMLCHTLENQAFLSSCNLHPDLLLPIPTTKAKTKSRSPGRHCRSSFWWLSSLSLLASTAFNTRTRSVPGARFPDHIVLCR